MKRLIILPALVLTTALALNACSSSGASVTPGDSTVVIPTTLAPATTQAHTTTPTTEATTTEASTTDPATTPAPTTAKPVPATTAKPVPVTTQKPATVSGTPEQLAEKAAVSFGNAVDDAAKYGDFAPVYQAIWSKYAAAGMTITIPSAFRISNPTGKPGFSGAYQVSGKGETFCLIYTGGTNYVTNPGAC